MAKSVVKKNGYQPTPVTLLNVLGGKKNRKIKYGALRVLLDTGCSDSLIRACYCHAQKKLRSKETYSTGGGEITTKYKTQTFFTLPEFSDKKIIKWDFNVFDGDHLDYDVVIGRDILYNLKIDFSFDKTMVKWEGIEIPMLDFKKLKNIN